MRHSLGVLPGRVAALALLAGLVASLILFIAIPAYDSYAALGAQIETARVNLGRFQAIISGQAPAASMDSGEWEGQAWDGQSESIVAANVQAFIQTQARDNNVSVISVSPLQARPFEKFRTIGLRIECEGEIGAVRDLIGALENHKPFIFIAGLDLRRQLIFGERMPGQKLPLSLRLDVHVPLKVAEEDG
ncbi:type II secretion system protein GspM [Breoghania sp. L-A4]|uniref:type II secretion system protein GspM n=1 Tax=Breoghania sp. L-A4 TaxID=2304600 RepID=UPI0013C340E3|nr:type II secretion system protein GspM [Breoghania sp. L-A4]